ncbi:MAG TPA: hypothetical protein VMM36_13300 [Opitutaceae bacterium]|nr:hypothetical protein [Opitutaceae bacterium]
MSLSPPRTLTRFPYFIRWILLLVGVGLIAALTLPLLTDEVRLVFLF